MPARSRLAAVVVAGLVGIGAAAQAAAAPFVPRDDAEVLERVRPRSAGPAAREMRTLRARLAADPRDLPTALALARRYVEQGYEESDPRYYGYAEAALGPWWRLDEPPAAVLVLRAIIRQAAHDFEGALGDLSRATALAPADAQAWVTRALVLQVRGRFAEAKRACARLVRLSTELVAVTCLAGVGSLAGQAATSYALLARVVERAPRATAGERRWALTALADMAARRGDARAAERHFEAAFGAGAPDTRLLARYADFLLDQGAPAAVLPLLRDATRLDALLLRIALAKRALAAPDLPGDVDALRARFRASRERGDLRHRREEARFTLHLLHAPVEALALAVDNWAVQREPEDARILLEAALAAGEAAAARPVIEFLEATGLEDVQLARLAARVRAAGR